MKQISLIDANKPEKVQESINRLNDEAARIPEVVENEVTKSIDPLKKYIDDELNSFTLKISTI